MKYNTLIIFFLCFYVLATAQNKDDINPNGYNQFFYANGQASSEGYMRDGKPDGDWKTYYVTVIL